MTGRPQDNLDRLLELLADRATVGLGAAESAELERLLAERPEVDAESMDSAAAALEQVFASDARALAPTGAGLYPPIPASVRWRMESAVMAEVGRERGLRLAGTERELKRPARLSAFGWLGWAVAAASIALAVYVSKSPGLAPGSGYRDLARQRERLAAESTDLARWNWAGAGEFEKRTVSGEVVWSTAANRGYMTFKGAPFNDPSKEQYQLWIFDPTQSDKTPVDGGVFDLSSAKAGPDGEVIVPIDPKLVIAAKPVLFAITIEKPGGVVVSDRSRLVLVAAPPKGS